MAIDLQGNEIINGFSTNVPPKTNAEILARGVQPAKIPSVPQDTTPYSTIASGAVSSILGEFTNLQNQQSKVEGQQEMSGNRQLSLADMLSGKTADLQTAQEQVGVGAEQTKQNEYLQQLANLNAQASSLNREAQAAPFLPLTQAEQQGRVITEGVARGESEKLLRENALKALSLGQQADIASAALTGSTIRLAQAKEKAQQMVDLKYKPIEDALAREKQVYELNKDLLTRVDKKRAEALALAIKKDEEATAEMKSNEKAISEIGLMLRKYGAPDNVVNDVLTNSESLNEALIRAGSNLQDPAAKLELEGIRLSNVLKQSQILKAQREAVLVGKLTPKQEKEQLLAMKQAKSAVPVLQDKITVLNSILESPAIGSTVGTSFASRAGGTPTGVAGRFIAGAIPGAAAGSIVPGVGTLAGGVIGGTLLAGQGAVDKFTGERQKLIGSVNQLVSKEFLQAVLNLKAQGGTLGQLTEREGNKLQQAATKIGTWEVRNKDGDVIGYNVSEKDFKDEVQRIKEATAAILTEMQGDSFTPEERAVLDSLNQGEAVSVEDYFN